MSERKERLVKIAKNIILAGTVVSAITGAILGISSVADLYRSKSGFDEHTKVIQGLEKEVQKNREEVRFLYQALLSSKFSTTPPSDRSSGSRAAPKMKKDLEKKYRALPKVPEQRIRKWNQLPIRKAK